MKTIKRIFRSFVVERKSRTDIAKALNADGIPTSSGKRWNCHLIHKLLTSEKYIGHNVYNRASFKLGRNYVSNPPDMWVRRDNAFKAIITPELFAKAQAVIARQQRRTSDQQMLDRLKALWRRKGRLTEELVSASKRVPHASTYISHFGSLLAAYRLIGFQPAPRYRHAETTPKLRAVVGSVVEGIIATMERLGGTATVHDNDILTINCSIAASLRVAWSVADGPGRARRWRVRSIRHTTPVLTLLIRMTPSNARVLDYYLAPTKTLRKDGKLRRASRSFAREQRHGSLVAVCRRFLGPVPTEGQTGITPLAGRR